MSTVAQFVSAVGALLDDRFYPQVAPEKTKLPYATYAFVGGLVQTYQEGANSDLRCQRVQINLWAKTDAEAWSLINDISDVIVSGNINGIPEGAPIMAHSQPPNMRGQQQDFMIWFEQ